MAADAVEHACQFESLISGAKMDSLIKIYGLSRQSGTVNAIILELLMVLVARFATGAAGGVVSRVIEIFADVEILPTESLVKAKIVFTPSPFETVKDLVLEQLVQDESSTTGVVLVCEKRTLS